jgi:hypothetical protein
MYGLDWEEVDLGRRFLRVKRGKNGESRYGLTMAGVGIRAVQEALGHKGIAMTVRYSYLAPDFMADAVEKLVPEETATPTTEAPIATDTRTDTEALASIASASKSVH